MKRKTQTKRPLHHVNSLRSTFENPWPSAGVPTWAELLKVSFPLSWYSSENHRDVDVHQVKVVKPDWGAAELKSRDPEPSNCVVGTWLGHAGALVEFKAPDPPGRSTYVLFDPIFSVRAGPTQYTGPARFRESPCRVSDLPGCHAVFISHNHYDHLDLSTVQQIKKSFPNVRWFVPLRNKGWFKTVGISKDSVIEMDWWETQTGFDTDLTRPEKESNDGPSTTFNITCVPAQHNSGRRGWDSGTTLWCGWVIEQFTKPKEEADKMSGERTASVYHAGDTGYRRITKSVDTCPIFKEIGEKFSGFDLSFIPIWRGGSLGFISYAGFRLLHNDIPSALHCSPADALEIHKDVKSRNTVAIHFGTFIGSANESHEAVLEFLQACSDSEIQNFQTQETGRHGRAGILNIGASIVVPGQNENPTSTELSEHST